MQDNSPDANQQPNANSPSVSAQELNYFDPNAQTVTGAAPTETPPNLAQLTAQKNTQQPAAPVISSSALVEWEASEYVQHTKGFTWSFAFGVFSLAVLALGIFALRDWFVTIGFVVMLVAIGIMAFRPPRTLRYEIHSEGVTIGGRPYLYADFQSFGVTKEGPLWSVILMPTARFKPPMMLYFEESQGEQIVDALGQFLPMADHKPDAVDRLASKIRF